MKLNSAKIYEGSMEYLFGEDHPEQVLDFSKMVVGDFWGERIHTVAAIVGSNGSGKSSILNGIKNGGIELDYVRDDDNIPRGNNLRIFYSPFIDDSYEFGSGNYSIDVSRYYEMDNDSSSGIQSFRDAYQLYESFQLSRNIALLKSDSDGLIVSPKMHLPRYSRIKIKLELVTFDFRNTPLQFRGYFDELINIKARERDITEPRGGSIDNNARKVNDAKINIFSALNSLLLNIFEHNGEGYAGRYLSEGLTFDRDFSSFNNVAEAFEYFIDNAKIDFSGSIIMLPIEELKSLVDLLLRSIPEGNEIGTTTELYVDLVTATNIIGAYNRLQIALMKDFAAASEAHLTFIPSIRLSSGEQSMYNILSTLHNLEYHLKNKTKRYDAFLGHGSDFVADRPKNLLFLFDEADLDFHPLWKKRFLSIITKALPRIFPRDTMSIIFTTHDPLTLSDMPSKNVFYLEKRDGVTKYADRKLGTFAANISDLLSDSFFVEDGLIGDFAKNKIN